MSHVYTHLLFIMAIVPNIIMANSSNSRAECGATKPMTSNFAVSNANEGMMQCSPEKPCRCHGKICLVSNNKEDCDRGNVFINGSPICGAPYGWNKELGKIICQELGFGTVKNITTKGELGEATSLNGWFYLSKPFNKDDCTVKGTIKQQMHDSGDSKTPSIEDCIGHDKWNEQNDYCGKNDIVERPKGVICTGSGTGAVTPITMFLGVAVIFSSAFI